jgi:hypothetical protein
LDYCSDHDGSHHHRGQDRQPFGCLQLPSAIRHMPTTTR